MGSARAASRCRWLKTLTDYTNLMSNFNFQTIDWNSIQTTIHNGKTGVAYWKTLQLEGLRVRTVEYSKGYLADHWCKKGHIVHCLEGEFVSELENGEKSLLKQGMTYIVSDNLSTHRSFSETGVKLLIIDGNFLSQS
jgi:hypothetical protein